MFIPLSPIVNISSYLGLVDWAPWPVTIQN